MQRTVPISALQRKLLLQLEAAVTTATTARADFLTVVLAGHDIETGHVTQLVETGLVVDVPDAPVPPSDGAEA
jgi:hypothetical protein